MKNHKSMNGMELLKKGMSKIQSRFKSKKTAGSCKV